MTTDEAMTRRSFAGGLHPLDTGRTLPLHLKPLQARNVHHLTGSPVGKPSSLAFRVNGGEKLVTDVHLPARGVYPWVLLSGEWDSVTIVNVEKL